MNSQIEKRDPKKNYDKIFFDDASGAVVPNSAPRESAAVRVACMLCKTYVGPNHSTYCHGLVKTDFREPTDRTKRYPETEFIEIDNLPNNLRGLFS